MKLLMISGIAAIALLASAATVLQSHTPSPDRPAGSAGMMSLSELHTAANKLPVEEFEDQSLVYSSAPKH